MSVGLKGDVNSTILSDFKIIVISDWIFQTLTSENVLCENNGYNVDDGDIGSDLPVDI